MFKEDNIFSGPKAIDALAHHRDAVIKADPPVIRVMYNINGKIILGNISDNQLPVYDSKDLVIAEAQYQAKVRKSNDYVYYESQNGIQKQILNTQANIYVLSLPGHSKRYFIDYTHLKNYLISYLMENSMLIE